MTKAEEAELRRELKIACYEREFLTVRLNKIRACRDKLINLLDTPTPQEVVEAGDVLPIMRAFSKKSS